MLVPDFRVSQARAGTLHALYLALQDPDDVFAALEGREDGADLAESTRPRDMRGPCGPSGSFSGRVACVGPAFLSGRGLLVELLLFPRRRSNIYE